MDFGCQSGITSEFGCQYKVARAAFKRGNERLERSKQYYELDGYVTDHVSIVQNQSVRQRGYPMSLKSAGGSSQGVGRRAGRALGFVGCARPS